MPKLDLAAIKARVEGATPGPWAPSPTPSRFPEEPVETSPIFIDCPREIGRTIITCYEGRADQAFVCHARGDVPALCERVEELEKALDGYDTMLDECANRIRGLIEAYHQNQKALGEYFGMHGTEHSLEDCPEDDTCECPEHAPMRAAWNRFGDEMELAHRRLDKIRVARSALSGEDPK
jgi:hypothetical protein